MEDWIKKEKPKTILNSWEHSIILQELKEQEKKESIMQGQLKIALQQYEKDIRKQVCDEIKDIFIECCYKASMTIKREELWAVLDKIQSNN